MRTATIGTVSHGTLRTSDLLRAFASELESLSVGAIPPIVAEARGFAEAIDSGEADAEEAGLEVLDDIASNYLSEHAPAYAYFGTHPGDGSDFGFWPDFDSIDELPRVSDPNEVELVGNDCVFVNDHGNVTVYAADGSVIWDCV